MPNSFSVNVIAPIGMGLPSSGSKGGRPVVPDTKINQATRNGVIEAMKYLRKRERDALSMYGKHNPVTTRTKAPVGGPPMMASGRLRNSVTNTTPLRVGNAIWSSDVGPNANGSNPGVDVYSETQERGRLIQAKTIRGMSFTYGGVAYRGLAQVYVPPRPFTKSITDAVSEAQARDAFTAGFRSVITTQWYGSFI